MAAKVTPYFILTADGLSASTDASEGLSPRNEVQRSSNSRGSKKLNTVTRNEHTRKRMGMLKQSLEESRTRHSEVRSFSKIEDDAVPHTYGIPESHESKMRKEIKQREVELVPLSNPKNNDPKTGLPYVYFVVSTDRMAHNANALTESADEKFYREVRQSSRGLLCSRGQKSREGERRRIQQKIAMELGIKGDNAKISSKQIVFPDSSRFDGAPRNPPATPATMLEKLESENFSIDARSNKLSIADLGDFVSIVDSRPSTKHISTRMIELPTILGEKKGSISESKCTDLVSKSTSTDSRKVHFVDGFDLPVIRGNGIMLTESVSIPTGLPRPSTMPSLMSRADVESKEESTESHRASRMLTTPRGRKKVMPLSLPKIDIVSGVYDELIIKAITSYVQEFPQSSKHSQMARQLLRQLKERTVTAADLTHKDNKEDKSCGKQTKLTIKELPDDEITRSFPEHPAGRTSRPITRRSTKSRDKEYSAIAPTCFKMIPPGTNKIQPTVRVK